ncbi:MAG TPA: exodeoxyribonuclease VII small subunit [Syntrophomonadaceae bacterium]|jgi:exodeoxyribonuclease VII small subunit|nr:exodeoxyribonuclease VII small subunit [Syntrophomonadaceae bacterium]
MEQISFDEAMDRLGEIIATLELGQLNLEQALDLFQEGVQLSLFCQQELKKTDAVVNKLIRDMNGEPSLDPFEE